METLDINSLILSREGTHLKRTQSPDNTSLSKEDIQAKVDPLIANILSHLDSPQDSLVVTNKHQNRSQRYFILQLTKKYLRVLENQSFQKLSYQLSLSTLKLKMNDNPVDQSFMLQFLNKIDHITSTITQNTAEIFKKAGEPTS